MQEACAYVADRAHEHKLKLELGKTVEKEKEEIEVVVGNRKEMREVLCK